MPDAFPICHPVGGVDLGRDVPAGTYEPGDFCPCCGAESVVHLDAPGAFACACASCGAGWTLSSLDAFAFRPAPDA